MKKGLDYFSFDVDFFSDDKILFISSRFGLIGEIIAIRLLTRIYRNGYYIHWSEDTALLFAKFVGDGQASHGLVNDIVYELVKRGFFDKSIFDRFGVLTSHGIQKRYVDACKRRKSIEIAEQYLLLGKDEKNDNLQVLINCTQNAEECIHDVNISKENVYILDENVNINRQSKVKERKVKKVNTRDFLTKILAGFSNQKVQDVLLKFVAHRKQIKKPLSDHSCDLLIKNLKNLSNDPKEQVQILEQSIFNGWAGIFELKGDARNGRSKQSNTIAATGASQSKDGESASSTITLPGGQRIV